MSKKKQKRTKQVAQHPMTAWLQLVQELILKHSTEPRKRGKYKGHSSTDTTAWIFELSMDVKRALKITKSTPFDENMAMARTLGGILVTWWACVQRAKTMDPNRPLDVRRISSQQLDYNIGQLLSHMISDELMGEVFVAQSWNFPFGSDARGGTYL